MKGLSVCLGSQIEEYSNELKLLVSLKKDREVVSNGEMTIEYNKFLTTDGYLVEEDLEKVLDKLVWKAIDGNKK